MSTLGFSKPLFDSSFGPGTGGGGAVVVVVDVVVGAVVVVVGRVVGGVSVVAVVALVGAVTVVDGGCVVEGGVVDELVTVVERRLVVAVVLWMVVRRGRSVVAVVGDAEGVSSSTPGRGSDAGSPTVEVVEVGASPGEAGSGPSPDEEAPGSASSPESSDTCD